MRSIRFAALTVPVFAILNSTGAPAQKSVLLARSAVHAFPALASKTTPNVSAQISSQPPLAPFGLAVRGDNWGFYSRGVNRVNACAFNGAETWLATDMGVKRVDGAHRTITHYTRLDGLPEDRVTAIAADGESAWAIVPTRHGDQPLAALCRLPRSANRWQVVRETSRPVVPTSNNPNYNLPLYSPGAPLENVTVALCPEKVCFVLSPVGQDERIIALCYDRRLNTWDEIPRDPGLKLDHVSISITWADVNRDEVWLGTTAGLLRYRLREKQWQRLLPERMVYAGAKADDGSLWLATYEGAPPPSDNKKPPNPAEMQPGRWFATHITPRPFAVKSVPVPEPSNRNFGYNPNYPTAYGGIAIGDGAVWLTPAANNPYGTMGAFLRLSLRDESWRSVFPQNQNEAAILPEVALRQPTLPRKTLLSAYYPSRFPTWNCQDGDVAAPEPPAQNAPSSRDTDGTLWTTDGRALLQNDTHNTILHRFPLTGVTLEVAPQVNALAMLNDHLYALSNGDLQRYDFSRAAWQHVNLPRGWSSSNDERLIPDGDHLWIGLSTMALRYDPKTDQFAVGASQPNVAYHFLGATGTTVWLRGYDNQPYQVDRQTGEPESLDFAPLPPDLASRFEKPAPFGFSSNILWCRSQDKKDPQKCLYIGYDTENKTWTPEHISNKPYPSLPTCLSVGSRTYFPIGDDASLAQCYDEKTRQWSVAVPKEPQGKGQFTFELISVDDGEVWGLDSYSRALLCYRRDAAAWISYELPPNVGVQQAGNEATRKGSDIYLGTNAGVWKFQVSTHIWSRLPGFRSHDAYLYNIAVSTDSVWSLARFNNSSQTFALCFDKKARRWSAWGEAEGFPESRNPAVIQSDGKTAWTLASGECFRLDPVTNRWDNVSEMLARAWGPGNAARKLIVDSQPDRPAKIHVTSITPDGDTVWLLPSGAFSATGNALAPGLIYRFDRSSGHYIRLDPDPALKLVGRSVQVDHDAVWIPTSEGVYRLTKTDQSWHKITPPSSALSVGKLDTQSVIQRDGQYWFFGADNAIRWKE